MFAAKFESFGDNEWPSADLGSHRQAFVRNATPLLAAYRNPDVSVAFGGHFNSGKSTLLAALIGRDILPIGDIPETGVACRIRRGNADQVRAIDASGQSTGIPFERSRIASVIAAYTQLGDRRALEEMPAALDIEVTDAPIPERSVWIDCPGINDAAEMSDRALDIASGADMLVWVLNSRQCLSAPEMEFLARFVEARGPDGLAFVLNVFLDEDSDTAWRRFSDRELPILIKRIRDNAESFGVDGDRVEIQVVSARAMLDDHPGKFGGAEFMVWLSALCTPDLPAIRQSRLKRCEVATGRHLLELQPEIDAAKMQVAAQEAAEASYKAVMKRRVKFKTRANATVTAALEGFQSKAEAEANALADSVSAGSLATASSYENRLSGMLDDLQLGRDLCDRLGVLATQCGLPPASEETEDELCEKLEILPVSVTVYDTPIQKRKIGLGALIAGVGLAPFTGGVSLVAAGLGAVAGGVVAGSEAAENDAALTRHSIRTAARNGGQRIGGKIDEICKFVEQEWLGELPPRPEAADRASLEALLALRSEYLALPARLISARAH